jgi:hypothetical protein
MKRIVSKLTPIACAGLLVACASAEKKPDAPITDQPAQAETEQVEGLGTVATMLAEHKQPADFIKFFAGTFEVMSIRLDTGEEFTIHHEGDKFRFTPGLEEKADYTVDLRVQNMTNLMNYAEDGKIDDNEGTRMMAVLFTPLTEVALKHPVTADNNLRKVSGVEDHIHTYLVTPEGDEVASHTLVYKDNAWEVTSGIHGDPSRIFRLDWKNAAEYQRRAHTAIKKNSPGGWMEFIDWYKDWRKDVSEVPESAAG